jgi:hypothetical protein
VSKPTHTLTARSKSGKPLNRFTDEPVDHCQVYGLVDLAARLAEAAKDPDIEVSVEAQTDNGGSR